LVLKQAYDDHKKAHLKEPHEAKSEVTFEGHDKKEVIEEEEEGLVEGTRTRWPSVEEDKEDTDDHEKEELEVL
jgi:hypothetical protein